MLIVLRADRWLNEVSQRLVEVMGLLNSRDSQKAMLNSWFGFNTFYNITVTEGKRCSLEAIHIFHLRRSR